MANEEIMEEDQEESKNEESFDNSKEESNIEIEKLKEDLKDWEEKYIRTHSDFENIKKRLEREKIQAIEYASEGFAKDLILVVDSLEKAISSSKENEDSKKLLEGVEITLNQLIHTLEKNGLTEIDCSKDFDPNMHEAVMKVKSEEIESGKIVEVMQKGYKLKERILRAAMVSVAE